MWDKAQLEHKWETPKKNQEKRNKSFLRVEKKNNKKTKIRKCKSKVQNH